MWIFLNNAFISAVQHREKPGSVMVRARVAGDLERVFPRHAKKVERTPGADYLYRLVVHKDTLARALAKAATRIDYANFKDSVEERDRHDAYMGVWSAMHRLQYQREPRLPIGYVGEDFDDEGEPCPCGADGGTSCGANCLQLVALPVIDVMKKE